MLKLIENLDRLLGSKAQEREKHPLAELSMSLDATIISHPPNMASSGVSSSTAGKLTAETPPVAAHMQNCGLRRLKSPSAKLSFN